MRNANGINADEVFGSDNLNYAVNIADAGRLDSTLQADDDSDTDYNAKIEQRLMRGKVYILRIRLYYVNITGEAAVMLW